MLQAAREHDPPSQYLAADAGTRRAHTNTRAVRLHQLHLLKTPPIPHMLRACLCPQFDFLWKFRVQRLEIHEQNFKPSNGRVRAAAALPSADAGRAGEWIRRAHWARVPEHSRAADGADTSPDLAGARSTRISSPWDWKCRGTHGPSHATG